jgi:hypothetical protein
MGALLWEPEGEAPLLGALKVMKGRLWGQESLFMGAQFGNLEWVHQLGTLRYGRKKRALEVECLSLWELCEGNLEGGLFCRGP